MRRLTAEKPDYRIPPMAEILATPDCGLRVVSLFSGCGGSSLGYRMAGLRVVFASEFVPAAAETYRANFPGVMVDGRDIRLVAPEEILSATDLMAGELDVLDGSPPCSSFSSAGLGASGWGKVKSYSDTSQRTDDLFVEFSRILRGLMPRAFVAENVSGLVRSVSKGYFLEILAALKRCGYRVACRVLDAQWLGVPQARARVIFVGAREDLGIEPTYPSPLAYRYSIRDAIGDLIDGQIAKVTQRYRPGGAEARERRLSTDEPSPTISASGFGTGFSGQAKIVVKENGLSIERYAIGKEWRKLRPGESSDRYFNLVRPRPDLPCPTITQLGGKHPSVAGVTHPSEPRKFSIAELRRLCGFPDDFILTGTYAQQWERLGRAVPPPMMAAVARVVRNEILAKVRP